MNISGSYQYIGLRSASGAMYLSKVNITWSDEAPPEPSGYTVTWKNKNGSQTLETDTNVEEGATPQYNGSTPQWSNTAQYTYTFDGWSTEIDGTTYFDGDSKPFPSVTGNVTYYAHYTQTLRSYTVTWMNEDGTETLETDENVPYGDPPVFNGTIPSKPDGDEFTYTFDGWVSNGTKYAADALPAVSGNVTYTVAYKAGSKYPNTDMIDRPFTGVTGNSYSGWEDKPGSSTSAVYEGNSAGGNNSIQLRSGTSPGSNVHSGIVSTNTCGRVTRVAVTWNNTDSNKDGSGNAKALSIYGNTAAYSSVEDLYSDDTRGTLIGTLSYDENALTTVCTITGNYDYIGLRSANGAIYLDAIYITWVADHAYDVTWQNYDGSQIKKDTGLAKDTIPAYVGDTPVKASDAQYDYTFIGWRDAETDEYFDKDEALPGVDHDVTYVAQYSSTLRSYTVTWLNEDGESVLDTKEVEYGTIPTYSGAHPTKASDDTYNYYLSGWTPALTEVTGPASYTAVFSSTPKAGYTVTWENWDGALLETDTNVQSGTRAHYDGGSSPTKPSDAYYTYEFYGWGVWNEETGLIDIAGRFRHNDPPYITGDITFRALYTATPTAAYRSGRIDRTNIDKTYELNNYYLTIDGETAEIEGDALAFDESKILKENKLYLGDYAVADMTPPADATFAHTVYVTGAGTQEDPYVFHPNYIFSKNVAKVADSSDTDKAIVHPGDGFKGMSKIRIGIDYLRYLQYVDRPDLECNHGTNGFMGISKTDYGNRYHNEIAEPYPFVSDSVLFYVGELKGAHNFTERQIIDNTFGDIIAKQMYTVTWKNWDDDVLRTNQIYVGEKPRYGTIEDAIPKKDADENNTYTFNGKWQDESTETIYNESELPEVTGDVTYIAQFDTKSKLFVGHSLTLEGDIGVNFFVNVTPQEVAQGVTINFSWNVEGNVKTSSYTITEDDAFGYSDNHYYRSTCWVAPAEMTYTIHATATINNVLQDETKDYSVRQYGEYILANLEEYEKPEELERVVQTMLDYGAKAQVVFNRNTSDLANKNVSNYEMDEIEDLDAAIPYSPAGVENMNDMRTYLADPDNFNEIGLSLYSPTIIYLSKTTLRFYYRITDSTKFSPDIGTEYGDFVYTGDIDGYACFDVVDIAAKDLNLVNTFTINGKSYDFSALDYTRLVLKSPKTSDNEKALATATYWYCIAALDYFAE